jgi:crotonobetainyl-CoA:carnitine CoA-transferase CaiB-like acyl-CoA transferase
MSSICDGLTVVEGGNGSIAASMLGMLLADNGAHVLKVEPPAGDQLRRANPNGFMVWNRGKDSVVCDLDTTADRDRLRTLVAKADVFVDAYPNGATAQWELGHDVLARASPALITCAIRAFSSEGPYAHIPAIETIVAAKAGKFTNPTAGRPRYPNEFLASHGAAHTGVASVLAALLVRDATGRGQRVEVSLYEGLSAFDYFGVGMMQGMQGMQRRMATAPSAAPAVGSARVNRNNFMPCTKDGRWAVFCAMLPHQVQAIARACGVGRLNEDPRFALAPSFESAAEADEFERAIWDAVREMTAAELMERVMGEPDVACEIAATTVEAMDHPQVVHNNHIAVVDDPEMGPVEQIGPVARFSSTPSAIGEGAPRVDVARRAPAGPLRPKGSAAPPEHPLAGVTIVEFGYFFAMPNGTAMAAGLGARVIKIEDQRGDPQRSSFGLREAGSSKTMEGKESLAVDLRRPEGQAVVRRILRGADAFVCGFRPGVAEKMGLSYDVVHELSPRLVYLHAGGYGFDGPHAHRAMYAPIATAVGGGYHRQSGTWLDPDLAMGKSVEEQRVGVAPHVTSLVGGDAHASLAVLSSLVLALYHQRRTGEGQFVSATMLNANIYAASDDFLRFPGRPPLALLDPDSWGRNALDRIYPTAEGHVVLFVETDRELVALAAALDQPELAATPRLADADLAETLGDAFRKRPAQAWEDHLLAAGVACVKVTETSPSVFTIEDQGLRETGLTCEVDDPAFGRIVRHGPPALFSLTPGRVAPTCLAGQHTVAILREYGYSEEEVASLQKGGVVFDEKACNPAG